MSWIIFALLTALFSASKDIYCKHGMRKVDEYVMAFSMALFALPVLGMLLYINGIPEIRPRFLTALLAGAILNVIAITCYMKAIKLSDLSLTVPLIAMTPLFMLVTSPLIIGEFPDRAGIAGIILIVIGSYLLNLKKSKTGLLEPFKSLGREKGSRFMMIVAVVWSFSSNFDKMGISNSSSLFWAFSVLTLIMLILIPIMLLCSERPFMQFRKNIKSLAFAGFLNSLIISCQMTAVAMTLVAYVIAIKRTSVVLAVIGGSLFFKEKGLKERLLGSMLMLAGVVLITLLS